MDVLFYLKEGGGRSIFQGENIDIESRVIKKQKGIFDHTSSMLNGEIEESGWRAKNGGKYVYKYINS
jgi:hypothetical protein